MGPPRSHATPTVAMISFLGALGLISSAPQADSQLSSRPVVRSRFRGALGTTRHFPGRASPVVTGRPGITASAKIRKMVEFEKDPRDQQGYDQRGPLFDDRFLDKPTRVLDALMCFPIVMEIINALEGRLDPPKTDLKWIEERGDESVIMEFPNQFGNHPRLLKEDTGKDSFFRCVARAAYGSDAYHKRVRNELSEWIFAALQNNFTVYKELQARKESDGLKEIELMAQMKEPYEQFLSGMYPHESRAMRVMLETEISEEQLEAVQEFIRDFHSTKDLGEYEESSEILGESNIPHYAFSLLHDYQEGALLEGLELIKMAWADKGLTADMDYDPVTWREVLKDTIPDRVDLLKPDARLKEIAETADYTSIPKDISEEERELHEMAARMALMTDEEVSEILEIAKETSGDEFQTLQKVAEIAGKLPRAGEKARLPSEEKKQKLDDTDWRSQVRQAEEEEGQDFPADLIDPAMWDEALMPEDISSPKPIDQRDLLWYSETEEEALWEIFKWESELNSIQREALTKVFNAEATEEFGNKVDALLEKDIPMEYIEALVMDWDEILTTGQRKELKELSSLYSESRLDLSEFQYQFDLKEFREHAGRFLNVTDKDEVSAYILGLHAGDLKGSKFTLRAAAYAYRLAFYTWENEVKFGLAPQYFNPTNSRQAVGVLITNQDNEGCDWDTVLPDADLITDINDYNSTIPEVLEGHMGNFIARNQAPKGEFWPEEAGTPPEMGWVEQEVRRDKQEEKERIEREREANRQKRQASPMKRGRGRPRRTAFLEIDERGMGDGNRLQNGRFSRQIPGFSLEKRGGYTAMARVRGSSILIYTIYTNICIYIYIYIYIYKSVRTYYTNYIYIIYIYIYIRYAHIYLYIGRIYSHGTCEGEFHPDIYYIYKHMHIYIYI
ncbi:hypothetical protein AAMO2058_000950800 [Amorphochlora amoebiformis]